MLRLFPRLLCLFMCTRTDSPAVVHNPPSRVRGRKMSDRNILLTRGITCSALHSNPSEPSSPFCGSAGD
uniref:Putative secreted peptide n=1 Tax=Anopheles braziliensis TaxID=58242 RepID=A0A2M3ZXG9_9DIPT